jgi:anti-sigma factor RsiW
VTNESGHLGDALQDLLDARLGASSRAEAERHLQVCEACRLEWRSLAAVRQAVRAALAPGEPPPELAADMATILDRAAGDVPPLARPRSIRRRIAVAAIAAAAAALALFLWIGKPRDLTAAVARDYGAVDEERVALHMRTADPQALERFFAGHGVAFKTRVFDLGMMGYRLVGGRVNTLRGRPSALFVYRGEQNKILVCQMFEGSTRELPPGADVRRHGGIPFSVYRRGSRTLVFWPEGKVLCVLVSDAETEEVVALAFAKAVRT